MIVKEGRARHLKRGGLRALPLPAHHVRLQQKLEQAELGEEDSGWCLQDTGLEAHELHTVISSKYSEPAFEKTCTEILVEP